MKSGDRIQTGTWPNRRRLTEAEAMAGVSPERMTADEWRFMADDVERYTDWLFEKRAQSAGFA